LHLRALVLERQFDPVRGAGHNGSARRAIGFDPQAVNSVTPTGVSPGTRELVE